MWNLNLHLRRIAIQKQRQQRPRICSVRSLCVASVALAFVFIAGLYSTAYRATFPAFLCGCFWFVSTVCVIGFAFLFVLSIATMSFAGCFLVRSLLSAFPAYLRTYFRYDLVWFRLSCDHGWIRSGSVNVRWTTTTTTFSERKNFFCLRGEPNHHRRHC